MKLFIPLTVTLTIFRSVVAKPIPTLHSSSIQARSKLHDCGVFIQRWVDSSFDIYIYNSSDNSAAFYDFDYIQTVDSVDLTPPEQLPVTTMGSHQLVMTDVANPVNNNDPGKLSFVWGTEEWNNWSGTYCTNIPVGDSKYAYASNTSCTFQCDY